MFEVTTSVVISTDCIGSCNKNMTCTYKHLKQMNGQDEHNMTPSEGRRHNSLSLVYDPASLSLSFMHCLNSSKFKAFDKIWDCETNNFRDSNFIFNSLIDKRNWISQWTRLKKTITGDLKDILNENENNVSPSSQNLKSFKLQETFYNHLLLICS